MRALIANMVTGVTKGYEKGIDIVGVGYKATKAGDKVILNVGYSHPGRSFTVPGYCINRRGDYQGKKFPVLIKKPSD